MDSFIVDCPPVEMSKEATSTAYYPITDTTPPKITSSLNKARCVIKPIAFKPLTKRFVDSEGQQYGSTPVLARPSSHIPHYGTCGSCQKQCNPKDFAYCVECRSFHFECCRVATTEAWSELDSQQANWQCDTCSNDLLRQSAPVERKLRSASPITMSSLPFSINRKMRNGYDSLDNINLRKTSPSYSFKECTAFSKSSFRSVNRVSASEGSGSILDLASSPCDSSFVDMEAALRERDYELSYLRQTMEHNEQVIFKVYQEKEHAYERELRKLKTLHESRLRTAAQKSLKLEQMLMMQTYQLREEKNRLREENVAAVGEISALREEIDTLRIRLEETEWKLCQKTGELTHIKSQLTDTQDDHLNKDQEVSLLKEEIRTLKTNLLDKDEEVMSLKRSLSENKHMDEDAQYKINKLMNKMECQLTNTDKYTKIETEKTDDEKEGNTNLIDTIERKIDDLLKKWVEERTAWDEERSTWLGEKEKVLCYQKQLQLSYIEMFRRNKSLEAELENLSIELDHAKSHRKKSLQNVTHSAIQL